MEPPGVNRQRLRVLIAADKMLVAARCAAQLESLDHQVIGIVRDGHAAVVAASGLQPDLILLDLHLPPRGWIEAARAILSRQPIPMILLTGYNPADLVRRAQEAGVLACLVTPADEMALRTAIKIALIRFGELRVLWEEVGRNNPEHGAGLDSLAFAQTVPNIAEWNERNLQQALQARIVVERAKKALMRRLQLSETQAFQYMYSQSRRAGEPLQQLAENILAAEEVLFGEPGLVRCLQVILLTLRQDKAVQPYQVA